MPTKPIQFRHSPHQFPYIKSKLSINFQVNKRLRGDLETNIINIILDSNQLFFRVSSLVCKLKTDRFMEKTLLNNLPRLYFKSLVFTTNIYEKLSCFDHKEMEKSFIIVGSYLPCLESNLEVEKGCIFLSAALSILQNTPKVLGLLSYLSGIVKYIAKFCCLEPDEVATAAIKLLKTIILIEVRSKNHLCCFTLLLSKTEIVNDNLTL